MFGYQFGQFVGPALDGEKFGAARLEDYHVETLRIVQAAPGG